VNLLGIAALALSACSWTGLGGDDDVALAKIANRPMSCKQGDDCSLKWGKALKWVREHTKYRFRQATEALIVTENPQPGDPMSAFEVMKTPNGDGTYAISFDSYCGDEFGCDPSTLQHKADFVQTIMGNQ
jgi:hypothetical protein